jgi:chromate transporter
MFVTFFKIGMFTLGGGYAMLPLIQREIVDKKKWLQEAQFFELLALAQSCPGPIAVNAAVFIGFRRYGMVGSIITTLGITIPSFLLILLIAIYFKGFRENIYVEGFFKGIRPALAALIAAPLISLGKAMQLGYRGALVAAAVAAAITVWNISPVWAIAIAALTGLAKGKLGKPEE